MKLVDALGDSVKRGDALLVQLALAVAQGKLDEAEDLLGKAAEAGVPPARLISERAGILAARQKVPEAIAALEAGVKEHPEAWFLWARLTLLQYESKDEASLAKTVRQFAAVPGAEPFNLHVAKGRLAALQGNAWAARDSYLQALQVNDKAVFLYDLILPLDFALADKRGAEEHATALLKLAPGHNFANYIMGSLLLERKEYGLAEAHLRRSIGSGPTMHALNDYAVLLLETKRPKEAEHVARAALEMDAGSAAVLDTLGSTLTAQERYDEAFEYIKKSIEAGGDADVRIVLHWAEALARRGDVEEAKAAAAKAAAGRAQFTAEESDRLRKLQAKLGAGN
jgi:tetratricopeptide (TPR) repeat protein